MKTYYSECRMTLPLAVVVDKSLNYLQAWVERKKYFVVAPGKPYVDKFYSNNLKQRKFK